MELGIGEIDKSLDARERNTRRALAIIGLQRLKDDLAPFFRQVFDCPLGGPLLRDDHAFPERIQNPA